jgi:hypothetical protein
MVETVPVHVTVHNTGTVTASTGAACSSDCTFAVARGVPVTFTATPGPSFVTWSGACATHAAQCHVTPDAAITLGAEFDGGGHGGD